MVASRATHWTPVANGWAAAALDRLGGHRWENHAQVLVVPNAELHPEVLRSCACLPLRWKLTRRDPDAPAHFYALDWAFMHPHPVPPERISIEYLLGRIYTTSLSHRPLKWAFLGEYRRTDFFSFHSEKPRRTMFKTRAKKSGARPRNTAASSA
jgi:hypothetical protein